MARRLNGIGGRSTLSYIDMISGGFAAAFFLFLIFVSFPIETGSTPSSGSRFLDVWVEWNDEDVYANLVVTFTPEEIVGVPVKPLVVTLNSRTLTRSGSTAKIIYSGKAPPFWTGISEAGFGLSGDTPLKRMDKDGGHWVGMWMRFSDPCPGKYEFAVASHGVAAQRLFEKSFNVVARARAIVADGIEPRRVPDDGTEGVDVAFEAGLETGVAEIPFPLPIGIESGANIDPSSILHCEDL